MRALLVLLTVLVCVVAASPARAQALDPQEPVASEKVGKEFVAFWITDQPPRLDGRFDDAAWSAAMAIDDFVQEEPDNMAAPTERMIVRVAYDDRYVYVAVEMFMRDPSELIAGLGRRGSIPSTDRIVVGFDAAHDHLSAYAFETNPSGVQADYSLSEDTRLSYDYEAVWEVATAITPAGWNAEYRIPFSQMRFATPAGERSVWGFNILREIQSKGETDRWIAKPRGAQGLASRYGHLVFEDPPVPPRRVELIPFTLGRAEIAAGRPAEHAMGAGVDLRVGLGTSATLSATVNPDFGQVEQDPAVLNLSVFETFFPEKRPFFLEDNGVFGTPSISQFATFYSRRIGRAPGRLPLRTDDRLVDRPDQTTILGAAKVTGKSSLWTYGGLTALTAAEHATVTSRTAGDGQEPGKEIERLIEPRTLYSVGRVRRDMASGASTFGLIGTAVVREEDADAVTGGGDAIVRWNQNHYQWNAHWIGTRAPVGGTMRAGLGGATNFSYNAKHGGVSAHFDHFGRNFRNTDMGFLNTRTNRNDLSGGANLSQPDGWRVFRTISSYFNWGRSWNDEGFVFGKFVSGGTNANFHNFWNVNLNLSRNFRRLDDLDTRGGPAIISPGETSVNFGFGTDSRKTWAVFGGGGRTWDEEGGWNNFTNASLRVQASTRMQTSISANYTTATDVAQWIRNVDADGDTATDHVYGRLRRNVLSMTARGTYAFTRDLTLEAYFQPFVAVGDYRDIRKLARPNSFEFSPVTLADNPDFNSKSLRGTVVMRWEYLRGSTLYGVWNLSSFDAARPGVFAPLTDLRDAFRAPGTNSFAVKISYWLSM